MADIDEDEENYLRAILLLLKGCRYIALEVVLRAVRGKEEESGKDLDAVLKDAKEKLNQVFNSKQRKKLFPDGDVSTQTEAWDISLLTGVILNCYKKSLTPPEHQAVKTIKHKRDTLLGHSSLASLPNEDYDDVCRELKNAINILSSTFDESVKQKCTHLVIQSLTGSLQTAKEEVKTIKDYDNLCKVLVKKIEELEKKNRALRSQIEKLIEERRNQAFKNVQVLQAELTISAHENDRHVVDTAECILTRVIDEAIRRVGSDAPLKAIQIAVDDLLNELEQNDIKVLSVAQKCILLRVKCTSYRQVLRLIEFTDDAKFHSLLTKLAEALTRHLDLNHALELSIRISKKSVEDMLACLADENAQANKKLSLAVQYQSVAGLSHLWSFIEEGKGASRVERLSKALSKHLGKDISIELSLNQEQVLKALQNPELTAVAFGRLGGTVGQPFYESVYMTSAEYLNYCKLCLDVQKGTEASKYCLHCQENFCEICLKKHKESESKAKPFGHIDMAQSDSSTRSKSMKITERSTQQCEGCKKENVEYFCPQHYILACGPCLEQNHKTCSIVWIQTKAVGVAGAKELRDTKDKMLDQIKNTEEMQNYLSTKSEDNEKSLQQAKGKMEEYYKNVLQRLEHMKNETISDAEKAQRLRSKRAQELNDKIIEYHNELTKLREKIKLKVQKGREADVFALMKKAKMILHSLETFCMEKEHILQTATYTFEPDIKVEELLSGRCVLGTIIDKGYTLENLARSLHEKKLEVRTKTDKQKCSITGCAILNVNRLLLVDANNSKLKILDKREESIVEELSLNESSCFDVVVLPNNQAAVTQPEKESIVFVKTFGLMEEVKSVKIHKKCFGITFSEKREHIYIACCNPCCIVGIDLNGNIQREIALTGTEEVHFKMTQYITVDPENRFFYLSENSFVARVTLDGHSQKVCKTEHFTDLRGLSVLDENTILVCSKKSRCVHKISADMEYAGMLRTGIPDAQTVCFLKNTKQLFVGSSDTFARIIEIP